MVSSDLDLEAIRIANSKDGCSDEGLTLFSKVAARWQ